MCQTVLLRILEKFCSVFLPIHFPYCVYDILILSFSTPWNHTYILCRDHVERESTDVWITQK